MRQRLGLLISILGVLLMRPGSAFSDSVVSNEEAVLQIGDKKSIKPLFDFYRIGALKPNASAGSLYVTDKERGLWRGIEADLKEIGAQQGNPRGGDALIVLACGRWLFEKDAAGAIQVATSVITNFPSAPSILSANPNDMISPVRLHPLWFAYIADSVLQERSTRRYVEREVFVSHMMKHPSFCADVAAILVYAIARQQGDKNTAEDMLTGILKRNPVANLQRTKAYDRSATTRVGGRSVEDLIRPEISAGLYLALHYEADGDVSRSCETARAFSTAISSDGFYWKMNKIVGDILVANRSEHRDAEVQYRLALAGHIEYVGRAVLRAKTEKTNMQPEMWEEQMLDLKKCIQKAGGRISLDAKELQTIITSVSSQQDDASFEEKWRQQMIAINKREGSLSSAAARQVEVVKIADAVLQNQGAAGNQKKLTLQEKRSVAIGLAQLAGQEPDADTRRIMLGKMTEIGGAVSAGKPDRPISQSDSEKVDLLIRLLSGETGIEGAVQHPNPGSDLADMDVAALLYAAERVGQGSLELPTRQAITKALASSGNPALFKFFAEIVQGAEDKKLTRFAVRGLERILEQSMANEQNQKRAQ